MLEGIAETFLPRYASFGFAKNFLKSDGQLLFIITLVPQYLMGATIINSYNDFYG